MLTGVLLANGTLNASILNSLYNENLVKEGISFWLLWKRGLLFVCACEGSVGRAYARSWEGVHMLLWGAWSLSLAGWLLTLLVPKWHCHALLFLLLKHEFGDDLLRYLWPLINSLNWAWCADLNSIILETKRTDCEFGIRMKITTNLCQKKFKIYFYVCVSLCAPHECKNPGWLENVGFPGTKVMGGYKLCRWFEFSTPRHWTNQPSIQALEKKSIPF